MIKAASFLIEMLTLFGPTDSPMYKQQRTEANMSTFMITCLDIVDD